ncbi:MULTISPECIES: hypothetical protein [unclassified Actinoplanes]|uniref:hypothetical protein n=1 Tax=unclassified Actinoplanes TaxID=2626549 RepID=UPI0005BCFFCC|nr:MULTISPECIES: hypothetical protein [unclassified Actinoplanes]
MNDETAVLPTIPAPDADPAGPGDDDNEGLAEELAAAAPRQWWNRGTIGLGAAVLLMGGFLGGVYAQREWGPKTNATSGFPGPGGRFPGGLSASGFPGGGFGQGGTGRGGTGTGGTGTAAAAADTTGTVKLVSGTTIYVQTADGTVVTVNTDGKTTVSAAKKAKLADVKAGDAITVRGEAGTDGAVAATSVITQHK